MYGTGSGGKAANRAGGEACGRGKVTGQRAPAARWAGGLTPGPVALGVLAGERPDVQLAAMIAAAAATS
jgi:hypothetical protein